MAARKPRGLRMALVNLAGLRARAATISPISFQTDQNATVEGNFLQLLEISSQMASSCGNCSCSPLLVFVALIDHTQPRAAMKRGYPDSD